MIFATTNAPDMTIHYVTVSPYALGMIAIDRAKRTVPCLSRKEATKPRGAACGILKRLLERRWRAGGPGGDRSAHRGEQRSRGGRGRASWSLPSPYVVGSHGVAHCNRFGSYDKLTLTMALRRLSRTYADPARAGGLRAEASVYDPRLELQG